MKSITQKHLIALIITAALVGAAMIGFMFASSSHTALGSTIVGQDYLATSTAASNVYGASVTAGKLLKSGSGAMGSVIITGANTGIVNFYDATTTDISKRTNNTATNTLLIASLPASLVAGTYTFDVAVNSGLYLDLVSGNMPTTTITFRN